MSGTEPTPTTFEAALAALEEVVNQLERGEVGLEQAVRLFEDGQRHLAVCRERLSAAQARIDELTASDLPAGKEPPENAGGPF